MADLFPDFSLGVIFDPDVLYDLENEYENELLASIDMENAVRNNTNNSMIESEISEEVTVENTEPRPASSNKNNNQRFVNMSSAEIDEVITRAETKNTKDNTKWAIRVFEGKFHAVKIFQAQTRLITLARTIHFRGDKFIKKNGKLIS